MHKHSEFPSTCLKIEIAPVHVRHQLDDFKHCLNIKGLLQQGDNRILLVRKNKIFRTNNRKKILSYMIIPKLTLERKVLYVCKAILNFMDILSFPFVLLVNYFEFNIYTVCQ